MKDNGLNKRFFKIFQGGSYEQVFDKINSFSQSRPVIILNYEVMPTPADSCKVLVFYSSFPENN